MPDKKEKTISYRRAEWLTDGAGHSLEKYLRSAHKVLKNIGDRTVYAGSQEIKSAKQKDVAQGGYLIHITVETPGEYASAVPKVAPSAVSLDLKVEPPPPGSEWLDGDAFLYVKDNHCCLCGTAVRDGQIRSFLYELFNKAKLPSVSTKFELLKVADIDKVKLLKKQGVKSVEIKSVLYKASANYAKRKQQASNMLGAVGKFLTGQFLGKPNDVTPDSLTVGLEIRSDGRFRKHLSLGEKRLEAIAKDIVENADPDVDFTITTGLGQKISPQEIFVKEKVSIDREGKTVNVDKAWAALVKFYKTLQNAGIVEQ